MDDDDDRFLYDFYMFIDRYVSLCVCIFVDDSGAGAWSILVEVKRLLSMTFGAKNDVISAYSDTGFSTIRFSYFLPGVENNRVMTHVNLDSDKLSDPRDVNHTSGDARPGASEGESGVQITCFSEVVDDTTLHFQIIILHKQIYAWIGCSSSKLGHVYAAASTRPNNLVSVTSLLGGSSDNIGSGIARRLVLKTGLNIILACNIPKNSPMLEANAEKILIQKLISLGYNRSKAEGCS